MVRVRTIGKGGLGIVAMYRANDGINYAVKQMIYHWDRTHYERFVREIKILAKLSHKNIMKVLRYDTDQNNPYYVMPYYKDGSLRDRIEEMKSRREVFSIKGATSLITVLIRGLNHAHKKGVIHRDLKPENIMFNGREPLIADWGIGKFIHKESKVLTNGGLGTKSYCPPEQWNEGLADKRSDIYSLGLIYRELLTGKTFGQVKDTELKRIIDKMTMQSPEDRYQSLDDILHELNKLEIVESGNETNDFWKDILVVGAAAVVGVGLIYLLAKAFESK